MVSVAPLSMRIHHTPALVSPKADCKLQPTLALILSPGARRHLRRIRTVPGIRCVHYGSDAERARRKRSEAMDASRLISEFQVSHKDYVIGFRAAGAGDPAAIARPIEAEYLVGLEIRNLHWRSAVQRLA